MVLSSAKIQNIPPKCKLFAKYFYFIDAENYFTVAEIVFTVAESAFAAAEIILRNMSSDSVNCG